MLKLATKFNPVFKSFDCAYTAGMRHAEFWLNGELLLDWRRLVDRARHFPLSYVPHFPNREQLSDAHLEGAVRLYRELDCRAMVIHAPMLRSYGEKLLKMDASLRLAVENHKLKPEAFDEWASVNCGLTLDVEHLWKFTLVDAPLSELLTAVERLLEQHGAKLLHVHMPGYHPAAAEHRPMYCSREMVFGVFSLLAAKRFEGLIVSEVNKQYQTLNDLRMDCLLFQTWRRHFEPPCDANPLEP